MRRTKVLRYSARAVVPTQFAARSHFSTALSLPKKRRRRGFQAQDVTWQPVGPMRAQPAQSLLFVIAEVPKMFSRMQLYVSAALLVLVEVIALVVRVVAY